MDDIFQLDGSDAQDRSASSYSERFTALKGHLHDVVLILESFDHKTRDNLKQDEEYSALIQRFLSTFTALRLPDLFTRIDQGVIKNGLLDIIAQLASGRTVNESDAAARKEQPFVDPGISSPPSTSHVLQVPKSMSLATSPGEASGSQQSRGTSSSTKSVTVHVHFLQGSCRSTIGQVLKVVNRILAATGGRVEEGRYLYHQTQDPGNGSRWPNGMLWTCSNASENFLRALEDIDFSFLWSPRDAVVHFRRGGTISYGLSIISSEHVYDPKVQRTMGYSVVAEINRAYLKRTSTSTVRQSHPAVTKDLGGGVYLFSGPEAQALEDIVAAGRKTVIFHIPQSSTGHRTLNVTVEPFRLCDLT